MHVYTNFFFSHILPHAFYAVALILMRRNVVAPVYYLSIHACTGTLYGVIMQSDAVAV